MSKSKEVDELVPDPIVRREFNVTDMALWRWDHNEEMIAAGWPPPIRINKRKFRSRKALETFKAALQRRALDDRTMRKSVGAEEKEAGMEK